MSRCQFGGPTEGVPCAGDSSKVCQSVSVPLPTLSRPSSHPSPRRAWRGPYSGREDPLHQEAAQASGPVSLPPDVKGSRNPYETRRANAPHRRLRRYFRTKRRPEYEPSHQLADRANRTSSPRPSTTDDGVGTGGRANSAPSGET